MVEKIEGQPIKNQALSVRLKEFEEYVGYKSIFSK